MKKILLTLLTLSIIQSTFACMPAIPPCLGTSIKNNEDCMTKFNLDNEIEHKKIVEGEMKQYFLRSHNASISNSLHFIQITPFLGDGSNCFGTSAYFVRKFIFYTLVFLISLPIAILLYFRYRKAMIMKKEP